MPGGCDINRGQLEVLWQEVPSSTPKVDWVDWSIVVHSSGDNSTTACASNSCDGVVEKSLEESMCDVARCDTLLVKNDLDDSSDFSWKVTYSGQVCLKLGMQADVRRDSSWLHHRGGKGNLGGQPRHHQWVHQWVPKKNTGQQGVLRWQSILEERLVVKQ
ncbi:hypothetical protein AaE_003827 [Aphanomyces astaci]|uniref:Uncharacterized protein n=1 Tax=Aphanomyces astaci TaxID=112090 RepID=A0A6A5ASV7_APHAT|nr:hypothetical protein AaE_003827 [Aphanomyces astaci]